ncbi:MULTISPECIES: twin transmembrane helix small protein [Halocynthiibacter]|uniref:Twin transmembrane helix small protein n=1 Tax=Halocynthiibacter halioticoli TaxID=2986804 RepID=A0AAE3LSK3_9RHOB|nr:MULTISPECIES: twin transmembrane helix small protein [Halocynthiibacter]MCV6825913.1 twin transmembrane helix small protein [Halocynthiibacter halioticoli]MCW4058914.1 twin transmembrane helix small protein [Halocynthiibacter sp. SDUM655004]MDE0588425.1 twin transmembrane helix small protein [Halocynthiibacter sp. C4]
MLQDPLFLLVVAAVLLVLVVLVIGILGFARGGEFNRKHGNRMMRYRVAAQLLAVVLIVIYVLLRRSGG